MNENRDIVLFCIDRKGGALMLAALAVCFGGYALAEQLTLTTSYPVPSGIYNQLITTGNSGSVPVDTTFNRNAGNTILVPPTNASGRVGIGTASPAANLDVNGTAHVAQTLNVSGAAAVGGTLNVTQTITAGGSITSTSSDARLKTEIVPIAEALKTVSGLVPVRYKYKKKFVKSRRLSGDTQWGLLAQDVEKVLPQLVSRDKDGYRRLTYGNELNMLSLAAIRELKAKSDGQQAEIDQLKAELKALQKK
jgi:hypothetical protein